MRKSKFIFILGLLAGIGLLLAACNAATPAATDQPTQAPAPTCPAALPCPTPVAGPDVPNQAAWEASPHNDSAAEAFVHWDETEDKMVPAACATCHSTSGYQDFLGADGSAAGTVENPAPIGSTVNCVACHNEAAANLTSVSFLSGVTIENLGSEARCMVCHQGRATKTQVDEQIEKFSATDVDAVVAPMKDGDRDVAFGFLNIHYFAAAVTLYGTEVKGGYEYDGKTYDFKNDHVPGYATCVGCHDPHTLEVKVEKCAECHEGATTAEELKNIRMVSSAPDYDGDGDVAEGMFGEIEGLRDALYSGMQAYAKEVTGASVIYDPAAYPYFFADKDGDGNPDTTDTGSAAFSTWTPRLLKAAFNYQISVKDPGAFAHGNKYIVQLLYDSLEDLNVKLASKVDMSAMSRDDAGHFAGNTLAFRDWDDAGLVPATCAKCHSAAGLPQFIKFAGKVLLSRNGTVDVTGIVGQTPANGLQCSTCHDTANFPAVLPVTNVPFPNGSVITFSTEKDENGALVPVTSNICIECHQGRQSTVTLNSYLAAFPETDTADPKITFKNVHYFAAGATLFGSEARGIYEYEGKDYVGRNMHVEGFAVCTDCHEKHSLEVQADACAGCHSVDDPKLIRMTTENYDGSTDPKEPMYDVVEVFKTRLYAAILKYATDKSQAGIVYDPSANPYYFLDKDADGAPDKDADGRAINYNAWSPRLLRAAYNYQYSVKDPGAFAHNPKYVLQALYDSIQDLGGDLTGLVRPVVPPAAP